MVGNNETVINKNISVMAFDKNKPTLNQIQK